MVTKKQQHTAPNWGRIAFKQLKASSQEINFKGKTEKNNIKNLHAENCFKWIIIKHEKTQLCIPLNKKEYDEFKRLEFVWWGKK